MTRIVVILFVMNSFDVDGMLSAQWIACTLVLPNWFEHFYGEYFGFVAVAFDKHFEWIHILRLSIAKHGISHQIKWETQIYAFYLLHQSTLQYMHYSSTIFPIFVCQFLWTAISAHDSVSCSLQHSNVNMNQPGVSVKRTIHCLSVCVCVCMSVKSMKWG